MKGIIHLLEECKKNISVVDYAKCLSDLILYGKIASSDIKVGLYFQPIIEKFNKNPEKAKHVFFGELDQCFHLPIYSFRNDFTVPEILHGGSNNLFGFKQIF